MSTTPTTGNAAVNSVDSAISSAIQNIADPAIESAMLTDFPWLGFPVIKQVFEYLLSFASNYFAKYTGMVAAKMIIDIQTNEESSVVGIAIGNLQSAIASGIATDIATASSAFDKAMASLVGWDGSAT